MLIITEDQANPCSRGILHAWQSPASAHMAFCCSRP